MYCVKCGVRLQDEADRCPLCLTPVYYKDEKLHIIDTGEKNSRPLPESYKCSNRPDAVILSVVCAIAALIILLVCSEIYGEIRWGGFASLGIALFYVIAVLPLWFDRPNPVIFVPVSFAAIEGYVLYICLKTGGEWFLSFAFPVIGIFGILLTALVALAKYVKGAKLFATGGFFLLFGGYTMLIELFQHITFKSTMFKWSLYAFGVFVIIGAVLLLAGLFKPVRDYLNKRFFM